MLIEHDRQLRIFDLWHNSPREPYVTAPVSI
jgi:hypothetical protein